MWNLKQIHTQTKTEKKKQNKTATKNQTRMQRAAQWLPEVGSWGWKK